MADYLSDEKIIEYYAAFEIYEKDGSIPAKNLGQVMRLLGENPSEEELKQMIREVDLDGNGRIDFKEFLYLMRKNDSEDELKNQEELKKIYISAFNFLNENNDEYISIQELRNMMIQFDENLNAEEIEELIQLADSDRDGKLYINDFIKIMMNK